MKLFTANMKMADIIHGNYLLMPVISRFGISPGFSEKTVKAVCREHGIDVEFFLIIANTFTHENYFPERKLQTFNVLMIIDYLKKTHTYYIETQVPLIEKLIKGLFKSHSFDMRSLKLIRKFFWEYKKELLEHLSREEKTTFPYVRDVYRVFHSVHSTKKEKETLSHYSMHLYKEEHSDVDEKLYDLKNILLKYVHGDVTGSVYNEIVFELFRLEKDILDHTRIENHILMPIVKEMEDSLFHHTKRRNIPANNYKIRSTKQSALNSPSFAHQVAAQNKNIAAPIKSDIYRQNQEELTHREIEVLQLVSCGFLSKQIADKLSISLHTVISHRKNITRKLQIKTVAGLTTYALLNGLISTNDVE